MYYDDGMGGVYTGYTSLPVYLGGSEQPMDLAGNPSTLIPGSGLSYAPKTDSFATKYPQPAIVPAIPAQPAVVPGLQVTATPIAMPWDKDFKNPFGPMPWDPGYKNPIESLGGNLMEGLMQIILMISMLKGGGNNLNQMMLMMMLMPQMFGGGQQQSGQTVASPFSHPLAMLALTNIGIAKTLPVLALGGLVPAGLAVVGAIAGMSARKRFTRKKTVYVQAPARRSYWRR